MNLISIHALRAEGDIHNQLILMFHVISIHALRAEGDVPTSHLDCS